MAATANTSPLDLAAVKQVIDLAHKGRPDEATNIAGTISDPLARKLAEWVILRSDDADLDFPRYAAFIAANPSWPSIMTLRRRAEAALWQRQVDPQTVIAFFNSDPPQTAKGRFALARALLAKGDRAGAQTAVREAWRKDGFSAELEAQARATFAGLITAADDKARMDARFDVEDDDAGLRAAHQLDSVQLAIAKARTAVINKSANAKALLDAVPAAAQHDPGYMFSRIQWLRRADKIAEAAQWMLAAPHEADRLGDVDQWWIERRLVARKLLDLGDSKSAYEVANGAATPANENYRAEQQFTAGWIALRFLREPATALAHFSRIAEGVSNPITLARSDYWQGRAAEALGRGRMRAPITRRRRAIPPPITASCPARGLGSTTSRCAICRSRLPSSVGWKWRAPSRSSTRSTSAISSPPWLPTSPTRRPTPPRWRRSPRSRRSTTTRARRS